MKLDTTRFAPACVRTIFTLAFASTLMFLATSPYSFALSTSNMIEDPSFEIPNPLQSFTTTANGLWGVENASIAVNTQNGVVPFGLRMLRMEDDGLTNTQATQRVDVSSLAGIIDTGITTADLLACFNVPDGHVGARAEVALAFLDGGDSQIGGGTFLGLGNLSPAASHWDHIDLLDVSIPAGTRTIVTEVRFNNASLNGLPGFADKIRLTLNGIPEPTSAVLMLLACAVASRRRR